MATKIAKKKNNFKIDFFYDYIANTFTIWLDDKAKAYICQMDEKDDIIIKDKNKKSFGVEKLDFLPLVLYKKFIAEKHKSIKGKLLLKKDSRFA